MRALLVIALAVSQSLSPALAGEVSASSSATVTISKETPAQLRADALDRLMAALHATKLAGSGAPIESEIWKLWMASDSATADVLLQQATAALEAGDNEPSLAILDRVVDQYPDFAEAWNKRATLYFNLGRYDDSLRDIDHVLALEPRHFGALAGRGMILAQQKKYDLALAALREALAVNPQMADVQAAIKLIERLQRAI